MKKYAKLENMESRPRSGRPRKINQRDMRHLVRILREYPSKTSTELAKTINLTKNDTISSSSIRKNLFKIGLKSYAARKKPFMTEKMKLKRLNWCKKYQSKDFEFWKNVLFSDETMFCLHQNTAMHRVRRFSLDNPLQKKFISNQLKFPTKIMFWGAISLDVKSNLIPCNQIMNSRCYIDEILEKEVKPLMEKNPALIFQQDNAPCHTSASVKSWMRNCNLQVIEWPGNSPDLNIIENVWHKLKLTINKTPIATREQLKIQVPLMWEKFISKEYLEKLIKSMPKRISEVISNKGGPCKY